MLGPSVKRLARLAATRPLEKAGMAHKIDFRVGLALPVLDTLVAEVRAPRTPCLRPCSLRTVAA